MKASNLLNTEVLLKGVTYKIIGIDYYTLTNIFGEKVDWTSYTLIDKNEEKTWVSGPYDGKYVQWSLFSAEEFKKDKNATLNPNLTGISTIKFDGNPGFSTPYAEIVWMNTSGKYDYIALERFMKLEGKTLEPDEPYFNAGKILEDFKL